MFTDNESKREISMSATTIESFNFTRDSYAVSANLLVHQSVTLRQNK